MISRITYQPVLFDISLTGIPDIHSIRCSSRSGTFVDNMKLPVHRWYRYSAGFSAEWVSSVITETNLSLREGLVVDPFAGVGTTLLACNNCGVKSIGFESHPFVYRIAKAKLSALKIAPQDLLVYLNKYLARVTKQTDPLPATIPPLLTKCYTEKPLAELYTYKRIFLEEYDRKDPASELLWMLLTSILRSCSVAGTAQWQYVLPAKSKKVILSPSQAFQEKALEILSDLDSIRQNNDWVNFAEIFLADARNPKGFDADSCDLVITSPPYPNNYDYADATRLEMTFWGDVSGWSDLQTHIRQYLVRSCSQHAAAEKLQLDELLRDCILEPIYKELSAACEQLSEVRLSKGGKKTYHTMAAAYFKDLGYVFRSLRRLCKCGSILCFVVGDSAPYGVYLPVDKWLGELAVAEGFCSYRFEKIRDRNIKWKNRKHTVPLKEGRLWIKG